MISCMAVQVGRTQQCRMDPERRIKTWRSRGYRERRL
uniref:Uncharacterized protein n=1 Tax=Amphimedon queenslandica TaxID=400682 RepID=A0A1X7UIC4_AMPQE